MLKLYGMTGSGNCWKPALLMKQLGLPFKWSVEQQSNYFRMLPDA